MSSILDSTFEHYGYGSNRQKLLNTGTRSSTINAIQKNLIAQFERRDFIG